MKLENIPADKVVAAYPIGHADHALYPVHELHDGGRILRGSAKDCAAAIAKHGLILSSAYSNRNSFEEISKEISNLPPKNSTERDNLIVELARDTIQKEGEIEFDDNAEVSEGDDNGAYVQAWVWVSFSGTKFDKEKNND